MASNLVTNNLRRTNVDMLRMQTAISTGKMVNRPSDDSGVIGTITLLRATLGRFDQQLNDLGHASSVANLTDQSMSDATDMLLEAQSIATSQIGLPALPDTRASMATVIDGMINGLMQIANRSFDGVHLFAGRASDAMPFVESNGGIRYVGSRENLGTNLGTGSSPIDINTNGVEAFGALSTRVEGTVDLDPRINVLTRLGDINGARNRGVTLGTVRVTVNATAVDVDLSSADSIGDVRNLINQGIASAGGVGALNLAPDMLRIDSGPAETITIADIDTGVTAKDLGIDGLTAGFGAIQWGLDIDARLTEVTQLNQLLGFSVANLTGGLNISNGSASGIVDFTGAQTIQDLINRVALADLGVRMEINAAGTGLDLVNEVSGAPLSVGENAGGVTATALGLRSFAPTTALADFNRGKGVQNVSGADDFRITLSDGTQIDVNIDGAASVQDVLNAITAAAGVAPLAVGLAADGNGFELIDGSGGAGVFQVTALNQSFAAQDLGILKTDGGTGTLTSDDRATIYSESVFTHLLDLRDALLANDDRLITLAGERITTDVKRMATVRAQVGVRVNRVDRQITQTEDQELAAQTLLSGVQDTDMAAAISRFTQLQQQLEANLATGARLTQLTLLDFLR